MGLSDALGSLDLGGIVSGDGSFDLSGAVSSLGNFSDQLTMGPTGGSVAQPATQSYIATGPTAAATGITMPMIVIGAVVLYLLVK